MDHTPTIPTTRSMPDLTHLDSDASSPTSIEFTQSPTELQHHHPWQHHQPFPSPTPTPPRSPDLDHAVAWYDRPSLDERKSSASLRRCAAREASASSSASQDDASHTDPDTTLPFERDPSSPPPDSPPPSGPIEFRLHHPSRSDYSIHSAPPELQELRDERGFKDDRDDCNGEEHEHDHNQDFHQAEEEPDSPASPRSASPASPRAGSSGGEGRRRWGHLRRGSGIQQLPFSLWDYLRQEVMATEMDGEEGVKSERVTNFLTVPGEVEKVSACLAKASGDSSASANPAPRMHCR